jgi:glycosyltransferase involved in cell wall biosynthesis
MCSEIAAADLLQVPAKGYSYSVADSPISSLLRRYKFRSQCLMRISVCIVAFNEEANITRTLQSVQGIADEIIVVDSHSTDRTVEQAKALGAKVYIEDWKGFAAQKNSANARATCDWILSLDADEEVSPELAASIRDLRKPGQPEPTVDGFFMPRRNLYMGRWIKHGGYYPDRKLRLIKRALAKFELRDVHEDMKLPENTGLLKGDLIHHAYPQLESFIDHANRYSSLSAQMVVKERPAGFSLFDIVVRPSFRFFYNYIVRGGFFDGREGLLVHMNHSAYVSWKYAKAWELSKAARAKESAEPAGNPRS